MKTIKLIAIGIILLVSSATQAQVSVNVNIGTPPLWGPSGYSDVEYYYLPDVQAYYDIRASQFIYFGSGSWVRSRYLPRQYRNYDLYNGYKVVLNDYHGRTPYTYYKQHKVKYYKGYKGKPQKSIGNRKDNHDNHNNGNNGNHKEENGNKGHGKSKH
tara:strand:- start:276 stop:746 length:471 start_codon:yes stop_codon:yes gene_type:complete